MVVGLFGIAVLVVEGSSAGAVGECANGPWVNRVVEAAVAHMAGHAACSWPDTMVRAEVPA